MFTVRAPLVTARKERGRLCFGYMGHDKTGAERTRRAEEKQKARCTNNDAIIFTHWEGELQCLARTKHTKKPKDNEEAEESERKGRIVVGDKQIDSRVQSSSTTSVGEGEYVLLQRSTVGNGQERHRGGEKTVEARRTKINREYA